MKSTWAGVVVGLLVLTGAQGDDERPRLAGLAYRAAGEDIAPTGCRVDEITMADTFLSVRMWHEVQSYREVRLFARPIYYDPQNSIPGPYIECESLGDSSARPEGNHEDDWRAFRCPFPWPLWEVSVALVNEEEFITTSTQAFDVPITN